MNKSALKKKAKEILNDHPIGYVFQQNTPDFNFLMRIFQGHPEYAIKTGSGISGIYIGVGGEYKSRCFFVNRIDGSCSDISYIRSIDGATTKLSDIKCACRSAIKDIITAARLQVNFGTDICPISGQVLHIDNTHIDHYDLTFEDLFQKWISQQNIDHIHSCLNDTSKDNEFKIFFTSARVADDFISFHNTHTNLRAVSKTANLSTLKRKAE